MAAWFIPALKAILPHIGIILSAAVPVFTQKNADAAANQTLLQQQIAELQSAVSQNTLHIKELAAQLQSTVAALEEAASIWKLDRKFTPEMAADERESRIVAWKDAVARVKTTA